MDVGDLVNAAGIEDGVKGAAVAVGQLVGTCVGVWLAFAIVRRALSYASLSLNDGRGVGSGRGMAKGYVWQSAGGGWFGAFPGDEEDDNQVWFETKEEALAYVGEPEVN